MLTSRQTWLRTRTLWPKKWKSKRKKKHKHKVARASANTKLPVPITRMEHTSHVSASRKRLISQRSSAAISEVSGQLSARRMSLRLPMTSTSPTDHAEEPVAQPITRSSTPSECKKSIWRGCIRVTRSSWSCQLSRSAHTPLTQLLEPSMRTKKKLITAVRQCTLRLRSAARKWKLKRRS